MHPDVIEVPVEPVLGERNHRVGAVALDGLDDLGVKLGHAAPPEIAVRVIEDDDLRDAEDRGSVVELAHSDAGEVLAFGYQRGVAERSSFAL